MRPLLRKRAAVLCAASRVEPWDFFSPLNFSGVIFYCPSHLKEVKTMSEENLYTFENEAYRKTYWHTCSHVMAQAVKRLYP